MAITTIIIIAIAIGTVSICFARLSFSFVESGSDGSVVSEESNCCNVVLSSGLELAVVLSTKNSPPALRGKQSMISDVSAQTVTKMLITLPG